MCISYIGIIIEDVVGIQSIRSGYSSKCNFSRLLTAKMSANQMMKNAIVTFTTLLASG